MCPTAQPAEQADCWGGGRLRLARERPSRCFPYNQRNRHACSLRLFRLVVGNGLARSVCFSLIQHASLQGRFAACPRTSLLLLSIQPAEQACLFPTIAPTCCRKRACLFPTIAPACRRERTCLFRLFLADSSRFAAGDVCGLPTNVPLVANEGRGGPLPRVSGSFLPL